MQDTNQYESEYKRAPEPRNIKPLLVAAVLLAAGIAAGQSYFLYETKYLLDQERQIGKTKTELIGLLSEQNTRLKDLAKAAKDASEAKDAIITELKQERVDLQNSVQTLVSVACLQHTVMKKSGVKTSPLPHCDDTEPKK